jgi:hypothetical protein
VVTVHRLGQQRFHGDRAVIGRTLRVNRHELTIIGVAPPEFRGSVPGLALGMWVPMVMAPQLNGQGEWLLTDRRQQQMWVTARLKDGIAIAQADAEVEACARRIASLAPDSRRGFTARLMPIWKAHMGLQGLLLTPLRILMAVCGVLFLIVAANVANLQLARATARQREFGVRLALGAGPGLIRRGDQPCCRGCRRRVGAACLVAWKSLSAASATVAHHSRLANGDTVAFAMLLCAITRSSPVLPPRYSPYARTSMRVSKLAGAAARLVRVCSALADCSSSPRSRSPC